MFNSKPSIEIFGIYAYRDKSSAINLSILDGFGWLWSAMYGDIGYGLCFSFYEYHIIHIMPRYVPQPWCSDGPLLDKRQALHLEHHFANPQDAEEILHHDPSHIPWNGSCSMLFQKKSDDSLAYLFLGPLSCIYLLSCASHWLELRFDPLVCITFYIDCIHLTSCTCGLWRRINWSLSFYQLSRTWTLRDVWVGAPVCAKSTSKPIRTALMAIMMPMKDSNSWQR